MPSQEDGDIFELDEEDGRAEPLPAAEHRPHERPSTRGGLAGPGPESAMDPFRRAMPQVEADEDVCSICLDAFTEEDPGNATTCEHTFHLQCIMQWAQRSRECPLCFKALALQDPDLQELLPFGEYVPPEHNTLIPSTLLGIEPWDVDRLLQRLALQGGSAAGRRHRTRARSRPFSMPGIQPAGEARADNHGGAGDSPSARNSTHAEASSSQIAEGDFPSSWPPAGGASQKHRSSEMEGDHHPLRTGGPLDLRSAGESLKSRWSSFQSRCRESLSRSTSGFRSKPDRGEASPPPVRQQQDQRPGL